VKFLVVGDFNWEDTERLTESWKKMLDKRERDPDKWAKIVFRAHRLTANLSKKTKDVRLMAIFEADSEEQVINQIFQLAPYVDAQFIPIVESRKVTEMWMDWKR
jgi:hypothetical protein